MRCLFTGDSLCQSLFLSQSSTLLIPAVLLEACVQSASLLLPFQHFPSVPQVSYSFLCVGGGHLNLPQFSSLNI